LRATFSGQRGLLCVALVDRVFAGLLALVLERFRASSYDAEVSGPAKGITTQVAFDPSFLHEALRAAADYPKREASDIIAALEKVTTLCRGLLRSSSTRVSRSK
jgi:hypothetical protein